MRTWFTGWKQGKKPTHLFLEAKTWNNNLHGRTKKQKTFGTILREEHVFLFFFYWVPDPFAKIMQDVIELITDGTNINGATVLVELDLFWCGADGDCAGNFFSCSKQFKIFNWQTLFRSFFRYTMRLSTGKGLQKFRNPLTAGLFLSGGGGVTGGAPQKKPNFFTPPQAKN